MVLMVALIFASAAGAQPRPGGGTTPAGGPAAPTAAGGAIVQFNAEQIAQIFTAAGFSSQVIDNKIDDKTTVHMVQTRFWPNDTTSFGGAAPIWCAQDKPNICNGINIFVNLGKSTVDTNWINAWNNRIYFVRAYTLSDGSLVFGFDLLLQPGVTAEYLKTAVVAFKSGVDVSTDFKP
jgi:hypothetical protein